jgi:NADPH-dependent ferric siderophore reductase
VSSARASVVHATPLSVRIQRIVLDVPDLAVLALPDVADAAVGIQLPDHGAPEGRNYSVRHADVAAGRLTIDVVLHDHGPGTDWARGASTGDTVVLDHARSWYRPDPSARWQLLVADLAGLPALARILEESDPAVPVVAIAEVLHADDIAYLAAPEHVTLVPAVGSGNGHSASALAGLAADVGAPEGPGYCWFAGEAAESRKVRKHFRGLGWTADQLDVVGYWRADSETWERRFAAVGADLVAVYTQALADGKDEKTASQEYDEALERAGL